MPMTLAPASRATRVVIWPTGPSPQTATVSPSATSAYAAACQAVGSTSERKRYR